MTKFSSLLVILVLMLTSFSAHAQGNPRGDVNLDGAVNISDATSLIDNLLTGVPEGDVNQDGAANISDVTSLIDFLLSGSWPDDPVTPPDEGNWVDLGLPSGTIWATRNVGASVPEDYGDYFAWGETQPKNDYSVNTYIWYRSDNYSPYYSGYTKYCTDSNYGYNGFVDNKTELDPSDDAAYVNWGPQWRIPSVDQQNELVTQCSWLWTTLNGVNGCLVTGPNGNSMFLPAAGCRWNDSLNSAGSYGFYWLRSLVHDLPGCAYALFFHSTNLGYESYSYRNCGCPVRAVRVP
jgi:hypothetical protein